MLSKNQVKYIQSLVHKKQREEYGQYLVEGTKLLKEAIVQCPEAILSIYARPDWLEQHVTSLGEQRSKLTEVDAALMNRISALTTPPGVLAVLKLPEPVLPGASHGLTLVLDGIQDSGNLGTIIRTADWFGVKQILCSSVTVDCYNPKVVQATMGSIFRVRLWYGDLPGQLKKMKPAHLIATSLEGNPLHAQPLPRNAFLVIGSEASGVGQELMALADIKVRIPGGSQTESLNAAVATGIMLYALTN